MNSEMTKEQREEAFTEVKTSMEFGDLLEKITDAKDKIDLYKNIYKAELDSIPVRLKSQRFEMHLNMIITLFVMCVGAFFIIYSVSGGGDVVSTTGVLILLLVLVVLAFQVWHTVKSFIKYNINASQNFMTTYVATHGVHNMIEEKRYCEKVLATLSEYGQTVRAIEASIDAKDVDVTQALDTIEAMDFDIPQFRYTEAFFRS